MITKEQVLTSLELLVDPQYGQSVVKLNFIKDVMIKENNVSLTFITTNEDDGYKQSVKEQITSVLMEQGIAQVHIRFRSITDYERSQLPRENIAAKEAVSTPLTNNTSPNKAEGVQYIAIASGKGGVGKSTVTVNLAVALARLGKRVGIIDADIYGFSVPDMMGIEDKPQMEGNRIIPVTRFNVKVISMGFFVQDNAPVIWRGPMLGKMLKNFLGEVEWGELDYLLLDLPPGTGDVALDVHQMLPLSKEIVVTTPHATAAFVAARAGAMAVHTNHEILGIVENMSYYECKKCGDREHLFGKGGGAKLAQELHTDLLVQVPLGAPDNHVSEIDYSPSVYKSDSSTGIIYLELAQKIIDKT
jgi:ATP-binding protein involved in chromosome partitioning